MQVIDQTEFPVKGTNPIQAMFNEIAPKYDLLNRILSIGYDKHWRRVAVSEFDIDINKKYLDVATGTSDIALEIGKSYPKPAQVIGIDFSFSMLKLGHQKISTNNIGNKIKLISCAAENISLKGNTFDGVITAFGVRNFLDTQQGLREMYRILKPNGKIVILEFSFPQKWFLTRIYRFYFEKILPLIGRIISGHKSAYSYLPGSVANFPQGETFNGILESTGFKNISIKPLTFGIVTIYTGIKYA